MVAISLHVKKAVAGMVKLKNKKDRPLKFIEETEEVVILFNPYQYPSVP